MNIFTGDVFKLEDHMLRMGRHGYVNLKLMYLYMKAVKDVNKCYGTETIDKICVGKVALHGGA